MYITSFIQGAANVVKCLFRKDFEMDEGQATFSTEWGEMTTIPGLQLRASVDLSLK